MKYLSKLLLICTLAVAAVLITKVDVKADSVPSQVIYLQKQMANQKAANVSAKEYIQLQDARAKAEKRPVSDIEMVKRQALEGMMTGNNQLLQMGDIVLPNGTIDPSGCGNIAIMDQQAYEGMVSGLAYLEEIKQKTWMQYEFVY